MPTKAPSRRHPRSVRSSSHSLDVIIDLNLDYEHTVAGAAGSLLSATVNDRGGATDHGSGFPSWSRGMSPAWEQSRWSARSVARTNDLDGDERRHTI